MVELILSAIDYKKIFSYLIKFLITQIVKFALKKSTKFVTYVEDFNKITDKFIEARDTVNSIVTAANNNNMEDSDKEKVYANVMSNRLPGLAKLD